ncbi:MAG: ATP-dependent helicase HrpB [Treponema sp.]|nr:ATP-dependent helicase HrpB [Treponema sp.]
MYTLPDLPVTPFIPKIAETLKNSASRFLVLTAETGAGKSTVIPAGLINFFEGKILMTEPRRIAALSIAERISEILGEECGKTCGYKIHLENKTSVNTKIEVTTEAVLSRILQNDPSLSEYSVILIDEFHERSLQADLNLAFLREAMELREDLFVIIMSATIETKKLTDYLSRTGNNDNPENHSVPVMEIPGRTFPVSVEYKPSVSVTQAVLEELLNNERTTYQKNSKVILVFLPGIKEIRKTENELLTYSLKNTEVCLLHSSVSLSEQKKIFSPIPKNTNRIIISSAIAETSLTVPGVTTVIDSGLSRINRLNISLGMETLFTENESEFSAEQRKGRAGRTQEGRCIRLWNKNEPRQKSMLPEILRTDISSLILECAGWGTIPENNDDFFLDTPTKAAIKTSLEFLQTLHFLNSENKITQRGRLALETGLPPRLASLVITAAENPLLKEPAIKLILKYSNYAETKSELQKKFCDDIQNKIFKIKKSISHNKTQILSPCELLFQAFPDRLAKKQAFLENQDFKISYQFPNGHTAFLSETLNFTQTPEWLIAPEVLANNSGGTIFNYEPVPSNIALSLVSDLVHTEVECFFEEDKQAVRKFEYSKFGKIIISQKKLSVTKEDSAFAWCTQIRQKGLKSLKLSHKIEDFLLRAEFYNSHSDSKINIFNFIESKPEEWLIPFITDGNLTDETLYNALYWYLDGSSVDTQVPSQITLPNGKKTKVIYELNSLPDDKTKLVIRPVIEIIIQRIFGCMDNPRIMGVPVLLKLLSPAGRPLQITDDLSGFWNGTWIEICKEMKGRYPKHNWDYKIADTKD